MADQAFIYVGGCSIGIQQFFLSAVNVFADEEGLVTRGMVPLFFISFKRGEALFLNPRTLPKESSLGVSLI